jgi:hypothetical protein
VPAGTPIAPSRCPPRQVWRPALSGPDGERALTWALRLADELRWVDGTRLEPWLGDGAAGLAVLFATLSATTGDPGFVGPAERYVALVADRLTVRASHRPGLFAGLSGVAWAESVVSRLQGDGPVGSEDVDELIVETLAGPWSGPLGLESGLAGIGVYGLERARTDPRVLDLVVAHLAGAPPGLVTALGMADGLAGITAFTALAARSGAAREVLSEVAGAILARQESNGARPACAPAPGAGAACPRSGWCDGDVGIAAALAVARPLLAHPQVPLALAAALDAVALTRPSEVAELGLCHGLAGVAHVLHRVAASKQRDQAWAGAALWGRALLDRLDAGTRPAGPGFLTGSAGVSLALLALATDNPPVWDRALLLA